MTLHRRYRGTGLMEKTSPLGENSVRACHVFAPFPSSPQCDRYMHSVSHGILTTCQESS